MVGIPPCIANAIYDAIGVRSARPTHDAGEVLEALAGKAGEGGKEPAVAEVTAAEGNMKFNMGSTRRTNRDRFWFGYATGGMLTPTRTRLASAGYGTSIVITKEKGVWSR